MKNRFDDILINAKEKSIGNNLVAKIEKKSTHIGLKIGSGLMCVAMLFSFAGCKSNLLESKRTESYEMSMDYDYLELSSLIASKKTIVKGQMDCVNIKYNDQYGNVLSNDIETYKKIKGIQESDLFGYYLVLGKSESEKVLPIFGYNSWDEYLINNNFVNEQGLPDVKLWEMSNYDNMQDSINRGKIK